MSKSLDEMSVEQFRKFAESNTTLSSTEIQSYVSYMIDKQNSGDGMFSLDDFGISGDSTSFDDTKLYNNVFRDSDLVGITENNNTIFSSVFGSYLNIFSTISNANKEIETNGVCSAETIADIGELFALMGGTASSFTYVTPSDDSAAILRVNDELTDNLSTITNKLPIGNKIKDLSITNDNLYKFSVGSSYKDVFTSVYGKLKEKIGDKAWYYGATEKFIQIFTSDISAFDYGDQFQAIANKKFEDSFTLAELQELYSKYDSCIKDKNGNYIADPNSPLRYLDDYAKWRYFYEYQKDVSGYGIGSLPDFLSVVDRYNSHVSNNTIEHVVNFEPNWWNKIAVSITGDLFYVDEETAIRDTSDDPPPSTNKSLQSDETIPPLGGIDGEPFDPDESEKIRQRYIAIAQNEIIRRAEGGLTAAQTISSPLVIDLDGNGFETTGQAGGVYFDLDSNGFAEKTSWIAGGNDGFVTLDLNENGIIDGGEELFGNYTKLSDGTLAKDGFEALAEYDTNADGKIDSSDEIYDKLQVWVDNGNGTTESSELHSLSDLGIASIGLEQRDDETGEYLEASVSGVSDVEMADGTSKTVADFWFGNSKADTKYIITGDIADEISKLPDVRSMGTVPSLHAAMAMDESGELTELVSAFVNTSNDSEKRSILTDILYKITGAENIKENSRGSYINARNLHVVESLLGDKYVGQGGSPGPNATSSLNQIYSDLSNYYYSMLMERDITDYLKLTDFSEVNGNLKIDTSLFNQCITVVDKLGGDVSSILSSVASYIKYIDVTDINFINFYQYYINYSNNLLKYINTGSDIFMGDETDEIISDSAASIFYGLGGNDRIIGSVNNETFIGGIGDDTLDGDKGDDKYIFNLGDGKDTIYDYNKGHLDTDTIIFGEGITKEDIIIKRSGNNLVLTVSETDSITIREYYNIDSYKIENYQFADGTVWTNDDIKKLSNQIKGTEDDDTISVFTSGDGFDLNQTIYGFGGNDTLNGSSNNEIFIGGTGDDKLNGGRGDNKYIFNLGDGKDEITDFSHGYEDSDTIVFGEGIEADDLLFTKNGKNLNIQIAGTDDSITVTNHFYSNTYSVENFVTSDGSLFTYTNINLLIQAMSEFTSDTGITAEEAAVNDNQTYSDIVNQMWVQA
ncbi:MAG: hypothetical protein LBM59_02210 [Ruminococcus sp.]|nr:hypothetical protein [Ruminococcus sp.]